MPGIAIILVFSVVTQRWCVRQIRSKIKTVPLQCVASCFVESAEHRFMDGSLFQNNLMVISVNGSGALRFYGFSNSISHCFLTVVNVYFRKVM